MGKVYYLAWLISPGTEVKDFLISPAGQNKAWYIAGKLAKAVPGLEIISLAERSARWGFFPAQRVLWGQGAYFRSFWGFGKPGRVTRRLHRWLRQAQLAWFLAGLGPEDTVVAYHSLLTAEILLRAKAAQGFRLVLELEEIYQDMTPCTLRERAAENSIAQAADGYLLAAWSLTKKIPAGRPFVVINGNYALPEQGESAIPASDGRIHCLYAGTFEPAKQGARIAIEAAEFLPENYCMHIGGYGTPQQVEEVRERIAQVQTRSRCEIRYEGFLTGAPYEALLARCQIGLSTLVPNEKFSELCFPSKILVYLSHGLNVVSGNTQAVRESDVGDLLSYYQSQTPQAVAAAIQQVELGCAADPKQRLRALDEKAGREIRQLMERVQNM